MPQYLSPGVYVEEVPSAIQPIAGVGTSTAGFVGVLPDSITMPPKTFTDVEVGTGDDLETSFVLPHRRVSDAEFKGTTAVATVSTDEATGVSTVTFDSPPASGAVITATYQGQPAPAAAGEVKLCTNFSEFKSSFGDFTTDPGQSLLAHAVYGFFNNGGTRCYVTRVLANTDISGALESFAAIDEIALVAVPGITDAAVRTAVVDHCKTTGDRFAILDGTEEVTSVQHADLGVPSNSDYAAFYFPWLEVFDPATGKNAYAPPSGHLAGIYARVDTERGVHKAPANEVVHGALGLQYNLSKAHQDGLNPQGVNVIRNLNGNIRVWGARTIGGDANGEWKYVNVRRLFLFLRESIDEGTQWVVFEPNAPGLWAKVTRNVTAFLTNVWRSDALFGNTPEEAFYVKCDQETNPPEVRELGQLVTEVGVAVVRPAEFVVFRISQRSAAGS